MGNTCCGKSKAAKEKLDPGTNSALQQIREAQMNYFNSHIESDLENSEEEEDEESTDGLDDSWDAFDDAGGVEDASTAMPRPDPSSNTGASVDNPVQNGNLKIPSTNNTGESHADGKAGKDSKAEKKANVKRRKKAKFIRLSKRGNFFSIFNTEDKRARSVDPRQYQYPFENIVFEGGGNKGLAYCGAVRLLEELNIWPQIRRLAGSSAGAMTAALLAVGYDSHDLEQFFSLNLNDIFLDHKFGYLSLFPNILSSYGWNPGKKIYKWFGEKLLDRTNDMDVTFKQVYQMFDRELCIVATNLNQMTSLYCHPKTTPDMPVRLAVRMSMSIPGMFQAVKHTLYGQTDVFVDGGVLCNYPIHCFDGWWLSMKPEDNFLEKLQPLEDIPRLLERTERFGTYNERTLGLQLYADNEQDLLKYQLENLRHGVQLQELPNTKLAREKIKKKKLQLKTDREHRRLVKAMNSFLRTLRIHNADKNDNIDREELEAALQDEGLFPRKRRLILFGDVSSDVILDYLDRDHNGQISYNELVHFMEETGISMQNRFLGYQRRTIRNFSSFLDTLQATLLTNVKRVYVEERDLNRTVGINTGHIGTSDFVLEKADVEFVLERGRRSLEAFLKYYVASHNLKKRPEFRRMQNELRTDSKASVISGISSESNSSSSLLPTVPPAVLGLRRLDVSSSSHNNDGNVCVTETHHPRSKSNSSGKNVHISDRVEVMDDSYDEGSSSNFLIGEDGTEDGEAVDVIEDDLDSETNLLLDGIRDGDTVNCVDTDNNILKAVEAESGSSLHLPLRSSLQVDAVIHKSPESPTTPLLHAADMPDSLAMGPLG